MFLHGYLSSGKSFAKQFGALGKDFELFAPDLKGFGENGGMDYPYSLDDYILEVKEFMSKNDIIFPHVIAHSFGARIAIKLAADSPKTFDKLVLCGAAGLKPKVTLKKRVKRLTFNALKAFLPKERLKGFYSSDYLALDDTMKKSFNLIINEHLDGRLKDIRNQTLIVFGDKDKETPLYMAKRLNDGIKNGWLLVLKDAGHFCFVDKPLKFNTEVREFLLS